MLRHELESFHEHTRTPLKYLDSGQRRRLREYKDTVKMTTKMHAADKFTRLETCDPSDMHGSLRDDDFDEREYDYDSGEGSAC